MKHRSWLLPVTIGACAGWFTASVQPQKAPAEPPAASTDRKPPAFSPFNTEKASAAASLENHPAFEAVGRELASAEDQIARIAAAGIVELKALQGELGRGFGDSLSQISARTAYWQRWVELDPAGGLKWLMPKDSSAAGELLAAWLRTDPAAAMAWAKEHPGVRPWVALHFGADAREYAAIVCASLAEPAALGKPDASYKLEMLAQMDPAAAQSLFDSLSGDDPRRASMAAQMAAGMAAHDPAAALAWLRGQNLGPGLNDALFTALWRIAGTHPGVAQRELESLPLTGKQKGLLHGGIAAGLAAQNPRVLRDWLTTLPAGSFTGDEYASLRHMKAGDLSLVEMHSLMTEAGRTGAEISPTQGWDWTGRDPAAEFTQLSRLPDDDARTLLLKSLKQAIILSGQFPPPEAAAGLPENLRAELALEFSHVAETLGRPGLAGQWSRLASPAALMKVITSPQQQHYGHLRPAQSLLSLYGQLPPEQRPEYTGEVASRLAGESPQQALEWMQTLPPEQQPLTWAGIAAGLAAEDAVAASEWVHALPDDASRDGAVQQLSTRLAASDPPAAMEWALTIHDDSARLAALTEIAGTWMDDEPDAADAAFQNAALSEEERAAVADLLQPMP